MNELVSIIIPIYNQEKYLNKSLISAITQTYQNIEIVCVNDGSTDSSLMIIEKFKNEDPRIKLINQENSGLVHAVVTGVKNAKGTYICFLDSDDYIGENYVEYFINNIKNADFIAASHYIDSGKDVSKNFVSSSGTYFEDEMNYFASNLVWDIENKSLSRRLLNSRWNKMYTSACVKRFIDEYDLFRNVSFGEDTIFTYLLLNNAKSCIVTTDFNSYFYNTANQDSMMTSGKIEQHLLKARLSFSLLKKYMEKQSKSIEQVFAMYFFLIESLFQRLEYSNESKDFDLLYRELKKDDNYQTALLFLIKNSCKKRKLVFILRKVISNSNIYKFLFNLNK